MRTEELRLEVPAIVEPIRLTLDNRQNLSGIARHPESATIQPLATLQKNHIGEAAQLSHNPSQSRGYYNYVFEDRTLPSISTG